MDRSGFYNYLQGQGYQGEMKPDMRQYAQGLRQDGQHPWMDYLRSQHPNGFGGGQMGGLGGLAGQPNWQHMGGQMPGPRPMGPNMGGVPPQGVAVGEPNGMAQLSGARRMNPLVRR